jgi:hypothetical protein
LPLAFLSHFTDVWDPHVRVVFNPPPQQPPWPAVLAEGLSPPPRDPVPAGSTPSRRPPPSASTSPSICLLPLGRHAAYLAGRSFTSPRLQQAAMGVSSKGSIRAVVTPQHLSLSSNRSLPPPQSAEAFLLAQPQRPIRWKWRSIRSRKCLIRCSARLIRCGRDRITHKDLICDH